MELEPGPEIRGLFLQIPDPEAETSDTAAGEVASSDSAVGAEETNGVPAAASSSSLASMSMTGSEENPLSDTTR